MITDPEILSGHKCPYCGGPSVLIDDKQIYGGTGYGMAYICMPCNAYVGCHRNQRNRVNVSKGRLANAELRSWKKAAHAYFDPLWQKHKKYPANIARRKAYSWLSKQLGIAGEYCHIGMFGVEECIKVVNLCKPYYKP